MTAIAIRQLMPGEEKLITPLIREAFDIHISVNYSAQGVIEFYKYIELAAIRKRMQQDHEIFITTSGPGVTGIIELRNNNHISLLFVKNAHKGTGIGRILLQHAVDKMKADGVRQITVNSSPNSIGFYASQGFVPVGEEEEERGVRSLSMKLDLEG
ncbi:GNAT family N-acetyltransferase [Paenibacillus sp. IHB B 3415]|uniref:GNAT family N-acetyltransferase n=1 Tax=Paenibacillus sp. IHB B 3415 TaxID=867080 RepID=UPI00069B53A3|nr:GNAT family N-acetyltransferase [Paenibacillus sp. IHB B 3415]